MTRAGEDLAAAHMSGSAAAHVSPFGGLAGFAEALAGSALGGVGGAIDRRKRPRVSEPYPFYCAVLYTSEAGLDHEIHRYVKRTHKERILDGLTGPTCLLLVLESLSGEARRRSQPLNRGEVYAIADALGVRPDYLPAAIVFPDPTASHCAYFRWQDLLPGDEEQEKHLARVFRVMVSCMKVTAAIRDAEQRLHAFEREFDHARKQLPGGGARFKLSSESLDKGVTIIDALGKLVDFGSKTLPS